jgi:hypothetical protein
VLTFLITWARWLLLAVPAGACRYLGLVRTGFLFGMLNVGVGLWTVMYFARGAEESGRFSAPPCAVMLLIAGFCDVGEDRMVAWGWCRPDRRPDHHHASALVIHAGRTIRVCTSTATCSFHSAA